MILNRIRSNRIGYKLGRKTLRIMSKFPFYNNIYDKHIIKVINNSTIPKCIDIGTTNLCNASCIMCPHTKLKNFGTMDMELYKKIIDNCERLEIKDVVLSFFGEPLLDKLIFERIKYAKSKGLRVSFYSNGSLINKENAEKLIESRLDSITISLDGSTKDTYEKIRKGLNFDIVDKNVERLSQMRIEVNLVLVELEENKKDIKKFYKKWKDKVHSVNIINMRNWGGTIDKQTTKDSFNNNNKNRKPCAFLWNKLVVDWNGDVVLCCDDWNHSTILGNLNNQTIEEVWNGEKLNYIRQLHMEGSFNRIPLCSKCNKNTIWWLIR